MGISLCSAGTHKDHKALLFQGCPSDGVPGQNPIRRLALDFIPMLVFQTSVCALAIVKSVQVAVAHYSTPRVMVVLIRDSCAYFASILVVVLANIVVFAAARVRSTHSMCVSCAERSLCAAQPSLIAVAVGSVPRAGCWLSG